MSLDIFLLTLVTDENGEQLRFDRSIVEQAFASFTVDQTKEDWELMTPEGEIAFACMSVDPEPKITGFSVNRPPQMLTFWDATYEVLLQTPAVLVWPGRDPAYCVARSDYADFVPSEYIKDFGEPVVISSGLEARTAVDNSV